MARKIAVVIIHGVGRHDKNFRSDGMDYMQRELKRRFAEQINKADCLEVEIAYWGPVLQEVEDKLWLTEAKWTDGEKRKLDFINFRRLLIDYGGDAVLYQPAPKDEGKSQRRTTYDDVHEVIAETLKTLADKAGGDAPLVVIAHSLGTVIASNYIYDLQHDFKPDADPDKNLIADCVINAMSKPPTVLEKGETLMHFYTMGCPLAIWLLRLDDPATEFHTPVTVPAAMLPMYCPTLKIQGTGWINLYDRDDIAAYPLAPFYSSSITDQEIAVGGVMGETPPWAHTGYWAADDVLDPIVQELAQVWRTLNPERVQISAGGE